jgi:hypothetical protein
MYNIFKNLENSKRDCSNKCYPITKYVIKGEFLCTDNYETTNLIIYSTETITSYIKENEISTFNEITNQITDKNTNNNIQTTGQLEKTEYTDKINVHTTVKFDLTEHTDKINILTTGHLEITEHSDIFNIHKTENMEFTENTDNSNIQKTEKLELTEKTEIISSENNLSSTEIKEQNLCDADCETCDEINNSICLTCKSPKILKEGKCVTSCENDEFTDNNGIKKCKCKNQKCLECSEQSLSFDLCI